MAPNAELLAGVRSGQLAFAGQPRGGSGSPEGLRFEYLFADPLVVVTRPGHPVARAGLGAMAAGGPFPVLLPPAGTLIRQSADRLLDDVAGRQAGHAAPDLVDVDVARDDPRIRCHLGW